MTNAEILKLDRGERIEDEYGNYYYKNAENDYRHFYWADIENGYWDEDIYTKEELEKL